MTSTSDGSTILDFLASEFRQYGFDTPAPVASSSIHNWSLNRDKAGFILTTSRAAHAVLKAYLEQVFSTPKFDDAETLIYRNDDKKTTAMLNTGESTELIILHWQDPAVQSEIARARDNAVKEVLDQWQSKMKPLLAEANVASDEVNSLSAWRPQDVRMGSPINLLIEEAFADTTYPGDDGLTGYNPHSHDDDETWQLLRGKDWREMPVYDFITGDTPIPDLTPRAFHYYLPALLMASLTDGIGEHVSVEWHLNPANAKSDHPEFGYDATEGFQEFRSLLTPGQVKAVSVTIEEWRARDWLSDLEYLQLRDAYQGE